MKLKSLMKEAHFLDMNGKLNDAIEKYKIALNNYPKSKVALKALQRLLDKKANSVGLSLSHAIDKYNDKKYSEALLITKNLIEMEHNSPVIYNLKGAIYMALANYGKAQTNYETAIKLKPNYAEAYNNYGNLYAAAYYNRGNSHDAVGRLKDALEDYRMALKI